MEINELANSIGDYINGILGSYYNVRYDSETKVYSVVDIKYKGSDLFSYWICDDNVIRTNCNRETIKTMEDVDKLLKSIFLFNRFIPMELFYKCNFLIKNA